MDEHIKLGVLSFLLDIGEVAKKHLKKNNATCYECLPNTVCVSNNKSIHTSDSSMLLVLQWQWIFALWTGYTY